MAQKGGETYCEKGWKYNRSKTVTLSETLKADSLPFQNNRQRKNLNTTSPTGAMKLKPFVYYQGSLNLMLKRLKKFEFSSLC